jgi:hypothetical protein
MKDYKCPVCGSGLSKEHYQHALGIVDAQKKAIEAERAEIAKQREQLRERVAEAKAEERRKALERTQRLVQGKDKMIQTLRDTVRQLRRGTTPQTEGLEFEDVLTARLTKEFPSDQIEHKGHGGDVLHSVFDGKETCGLIVYELKRVKAIQTDHVRQAAEARRSRGADLAVLVTTGSRRGFNGFSTIEGVPVVAPQGLLALVTILRDHLIQMKRANVSREERELIAGRLIEFLTGQQFRNHIEGIVLAGRNLQEMLKTEAKAHLKTWEKRWVSYEGIVWDSTQIKTSLALVLHGKTPALLPQPKFKAPLLLENRAQA